jgi:hypothetical protein
MAARLAALGLSNDRLTGQNPKFKARPKGWVN